jgi:glucose/arabinose dehydrogenase
MARAVRSVTPGTPFRRSAFLGPLLLGLALVGCDGNDSPTEPGDPPPEPPPLEEADLVLTQVASGLDRPLDLTAPPGDPRLFVAEQTGAIRIIRDGGVEPTPFLDLGDRTQGQGERGLLGLAFHPDYEENGRFFVNFTDLEGTVRIVEFQVTGDPDLADPGSGMELLEIPQPFGNHNGGHLDFGPDGMLYVGTGDGGSGGDPQGHGQNVRTLLGGLLRLDVGTPGQAGIPPDNPFAGRPQDGAEELWAWGLRNPWRFSFDPEDGLLYIADVGQSRWEEINVASDDAAGLNYGWAIMEGPECFGASSCDQGGLEEPVLVYRTGVDGCAVVGGYVYRGSEMPSLRGTYFYSDHCSGWLRSFRFDGEEAVDETEWPVAGVGPVLSMGKDAAGELYLLSEGGGVYRLDPGGG